MIAQTTVDEIRRMIAEYRSQRQIAAALGVSRATVFNISRGLRSAALPCVAEEFDEPVGRIARCPGCGGRVYLPCRLCQVRKFKRGKP